MLGSSFVARTEVINALPMQEQKIIYKNKGIYMHRLEVQFDETETLRAEYNVEWKIHFGRMHIES